MKKTLLPFLLLIFLLTELSGQNSITIEQAREANANGEIVRLGENVVLEGKAIGPNFRPGGQTFALVDINSGIGITVFSLDTDAGYSVQDYDNLRVTGTLAQYNGLAEIEPTSIEVLAPGGFSPSLPLVSTLDESTESYLVVYRDAMLVDPSQWEDSGSFNVDVTNGSDTIQVRIDSDTDISGKAAPTGTFNITGIGGQYDEDVPYDSGYQLFPRNILDIDPYNPDGSTSEYTKVNMDQLRENDQDGVPMRNGEKVEITSIVYGVNMNPAGLQFTLINESNVGVGVYSGTEQFGYSVQEGDKVTVQGTMGHFNGLSQITPDSIFLLSQDNLLVEPRYINNLDESTESSLITFNTKIYPADPAQWLGDGTSFNVEYLEWDTENPITVRIDEDTYWADKPIHAAEAIAWTGIGGQFDNTVAHDEGYQLLPRYEDDFSLITNTSNLYNGTIEVYPNPTSDIIRIEAEEEPEGLEVFSMNGKLIISATSNSISLADINKGSYLLRVQFKEGNYFQKIIKQ